MLAPGTIVGPYLIAAPLGAGGMGEVYRARDPRLGREVAIKVIRSDVELDGERRRRFEDEARAAGALNHPNVLSVFDVGLEGGQPYVVFELLEGMTLADRLAHGPLPIPAVLDYAVQVCQGLAAAHAKGILHRDLKPSNLFLTRDGILKILDFGLAKLTRRDESLATSAETLTRTGAGVIMGTLAYLSPEQARGDRVDARSDLFALGATLYELLSGRPAFLRATPAETVSAILTHEPGPIVDSREPVPGGLDTVVRRCLEKNPDQRFQSARDLAFALRSLSAPALGEVRPRKHRRAAQLVAAAGLALAAAAAAAAIALLRTAPAKPTTPMRVVPFTTYPGLEYAPSFSPDGSQIAFSWTGAGENEKGFDLYTKVVGSEETLRLTRTSSDDLVAAWSPDGRTIAFARMARKGSGIYTISALGGPERLLAEVPFDYPLEMRLSWAPDGKRLAFADAPLGSPWSVTLLDLATLQKRRLDPPGSNCQYSWMPAFSPDGRLLALSCQVSDDVNEVYVEPAAGGVSRRVAHIDNLSGFAWTSDGASLVVAADGNLTRFPVDGGAVEALLVGRDAAMPAISRDGRRLAYAQQVVRVNLWRVPIPNSADAARRVAPSSRYDFCPALSADGKRLAFASNRSGANEIWISAADGSAPHAVTAFGGGLTGSPRWSPDGLWLALDSKARGTSDIYVVSAGGGVPQRLETGQLDAETPSWSSDGESLYFSALIENSRQVFKVRRAGGRAMQLTRLGGAIPQASRDGKRVYYVRERTDPSLWSVSSAGGDEQPLAGLGTLPRESLVSWEVDGRGIGYVVRGDPPGLAFFDFATRRSRRLGELPTNLAADYCSIALAPDGKSLVLPRHEGMTSDIMLVEDFR